MSTAVLALGKNWELPVPADPADIRLSIESKITAVAAGVLLTSGIGDLIIFSAGQTAGRRYPGEATKMREEMYQYFDTSAVPLVRTVLEEDSYDTATNLTAVKELLPELGVEQVILLSIGYHLPRVKRLARALDVPVGGAFRSDHVIGWAQQKRHVYAREVVGTSIEERSLKPVLRTGASYALEGLGWGLALIDPRAQHLARLATTQIRHQSE